MATGFEALTEKEKETLRLMVRGHDAKSMARELSLSVHTINDRLRAARRKLEVTSSREAARIVLIEEGSAPKKHADKEFGSAPQLADEEKVLGSGPKFADPSPTLMFGGFLMLLMTIAALFALQSQEPEVQSAAAPTAVVPTAAVDERSEHAVSPEQQEELEASERAALIFLEMADEADFVRNTKSADPTDPNYAAWNALIERRQQFGKALSRDTYRIDIIERDGLDEWVVRFHTDFERLRGTYEKVILAYDGEAFIAKGYEIE